MLWRALFAFLVLPGIVAFAIPLASGEEPWLKRTFGADWESYRARVPRWLI